MSCDYFHKDSCEECMTDNKCLWDFINNKCGSKDRYWHSAYDQRAQQIALTEAQCLIPITPRESCSVYSTCATCQAATAPWSKRTPESPCRWHYRYENGNIRWQCMAFDIPGGIIYGCSDEPPNDESSSPSQSPSNQPTEATKSTAVNCVDISTCSHCTLWSEADKQCAWDMGYEQCLAEESAQKYGRDLRYRTDQCILSNPSSGKEGMDNSLKFGLIAVFLGILVLGAVAILWWLYQKRQIRGVGPKQQAHKRVHREMVLEVQEPQGGEGDVEEIEMSRSEGHRLKE